MKKIKNSSAYKNIHKFILFFIFATFMFSCSNMLNELLDNPATGLKSGPFNLNLSNLLLSQGSLSPEFDENITSYTVEVSCSISSIAVTPEAAEADSIITINNIEIASGSSSDLIALDQGPNTISVDVFTGDRLNSRSYTVTVIRNLCSGPFNLNLSNLFLSQGSLSPEFDENITSYTVEVSCSISSIAVTAEAVEPDSIITINNIEIASGSSSDLIALDQGSNTISVDVFTGDRLNSRSYTVTVIRNYSGLTYEGQYSDVNIDSPYSVAISPDGSHVYIADSGTDAVVWFSRDTATGSLTYGGQYSNVIINSASSVVVSPDGNHVYVGTTTENAIAWFSRDTTTGALTYEGRYSNTNILFLWSITISPDGKHVYAVVHLENAVDWFSRDTTTGTLTYGGRYSNANIEGISSIVVSPDGNHVYVTAVWANAVAWFSRDTTTGALTYGGRYSNANILSTSSVTISPDGSHVYVAAYNTDAVTWFSRDTTTGALAYEGQYLNIERPFRVIVSPDGNHIYVVSFSTGIVGWYSRDTTTGALAYGGQYSDLNINGTSSVIVSPDNNYVYVTARYVDAITWFSRLCN